VLISFLASEQISGNLFSHRVLDSWNRLPQGVVDADIVQTFKSRYDRFIKDMGN